jgi:pimeloyl-ACP methyl ester carboxylesterase
MRTPKRIVFIHGLESSGQAVKAQLLREIFPEILTPDFRGSLAERMAALEPILDRESGWTIIGSSFGGLMGTLYTCRNPQQVKKLILLAPALIWPDFARNPPSPVDVPVVIYHGKEDAVVPLEPVKQLVEQVFANLIFNVVDDDHGLHKTARGIDWGTLVG